MLSNYNIIYPARIVSYNPDNQTASIQICAERITNNGSEVDVLVKRKPIEEVPVQTPSGGGWSMTMPIKEGDTCIILFSQVGYDHWFYKDEDLAGTVAGVPKPHLNRKFDYDDGFVFVGINTLPRAIKSYSGEHSQWRDSEGTQVISLNKDASISIDSTTKIKIKAPKILLEGDVEITGKLNSTGNIESGSDVIASGKSLINHTHAAGLLVGNLGDAVTGFTASTT
jgi:hypothetical protein